MAWEKFEDWTATDAAQMTLLGFRDLRLKPLGPYSGNGGKWSLFVRIPEGIL
jgi:hypothetical protein